MRTRGVAFLAALVVVAVVPAAAIGAKATNGTATVSLAVGVTPAKAGTSSSPQRVALSYKQSLTANDGSRLGNDISQIKVAFAKGFRFDINAVAAILAARITRTQIVISEVFAADIVIFSLDCTGDGRGGAPKRRLRGRDNVHVVEIPSADFNVDPQNFLANGQ